MTLPTTDGEPDEVLLPAVARGDEAAFRALYQRYTPRLRALLLRMLGGHRSDADDALQDTWVRAVAGLASFRHESAFATWLQGIGVRVAWEAIRRKHPSLELSDADNVGVDPPDAAERLDLEEALRRLPLPYRTVVVLHDVEGFGHAEIADSLGIAVGTSRSLLSRARRSLRAMLESHERSFK